MAKHYASGEEVQAGRAGAALQTTRSYGFGDDRHGQATAYETVHDRLARAIAVLVRDPEIVVDPPKVKARRR